MKRFLFSIFIAAISLPCYALVSDTITVRNYSISIDTINYAAQTIRGSAVLTVASKMNNVNNIILNLLELNIDSIVSNGQPLTYSYNDTLIRITPPALLNLNDSIVLTVYYNGHPQQDASWGGFYFSGQYAFNLGVSFSQDPHTFGPYRWDKIGYVATPVVYGGMEHATSIHISKAFIDGTLNYETLWAHELSHMWWGDNVTCESEQEMWLNEGMAVFNEYFFTQKVYGLIAYKNAIRTNHRKVLQFAHIIDGNYFALNNVPHAYTYGNTVYHKGADFAHALRNYMGDSLFFIGCHGYMSNRAYSNATSAQFRDELTLASGINMTRFFDDWIFTPGFPHFSIDSVVHVSAAQDHYWIYTRQKTKGNASHLYSMPVDITFSNGVVNDTTVSVVIDSATNVFHIALVGAFDFIALDRNEKISDAISDYQRAITSTRSDLFPETNVTLIVQSVGTSSPFVRMEHNWLKPDDFILPNPGIRLSAYHYWKVDGRFDSTFISAANFIYDGRTPAVSSSLNSGYIDNTLITATEDSLVLLYRTKAR